MSGKALVGIIIAIGVVASIYNFNQQEKAKRQQAEADNAFRAKINAQLDEAERKAKTPALLNKMIVDIALAGRPSDGDAISVVNARYSDKTVRQRAIEQIQLGYQQTDPISPAAMSRLAVADCQIRAQDFEKNNKTYKITDVSDAWNVANLGLQFWLPYVQYPDFVKKDCEAPFNAMISKLFKQQEKEAKQLTAKDLGSAVGKVTGTIGNLWDQTTKPISDKVDSVLDDFKSGYNEASK